MQLPLVFADRYRLEERLGAGAFGEVYAAFDQGLLQRRVAVKLLRGGAEGGAPSEEQAERFITELRLAGALRHPHIAAVYDAGVWQGQLYMVQELVQGVDLGRFLAQNGPLAVDFVLKLAAMMLDAVGHAHAHGVVHRDLKPGNLLVDGEHRLVVVDFGLATTTGGLAGETRSSTSGTPGYAAPEQIRGSGDARADQFSLGAVLYLLLTGVAPFVGKNLPETLRRTLLSEPDPVSRHRPDVPPGVERVINRALRKRPEERYPDLAAMAAELRDHAEFDALASMGERRAALAAAAATGGLVVVTAGQPEPWLQALRLPLVLVFGAVQLPEESSLRVVHDPREEIYPSAASPVVLALHADAAALSEAHDGLRAALIPGVVLAVDLSPDHVGLRLLLTAMRAWGASAARAFAVAPRWTLEEARAAERRGVLLIEQPPEALRAELSAELPPPDVSRSRPLPSRPYKFLSYFDDGDEQIFFGRDVEIERMSARVIARPVSLLYGASGAGKTSLVRAALAPRLRRAGHRVLLARVFDDPLAEICRAAGVSAEPLEGRAERLAAVAREGRLLVVVLDQLEELFVRFPRPAREAVAASLNEALARSGGHLRLVLCLRADYLARLVELHGLLPLSLEHGLYLESLSSAAARVAVARPAELHGVSVEPALIDQMIEDLSAEGVDPPQLQLVCDALWETLGPGERALTLRAYRALGEARSVLARHLQRALGSLAGPDQERARLLLKAMITARDTRSVRRLADIARVAGLSDDEAAAQLDALADLRLVRPLERPDGAWFELTHEVLAVEIGQWLSVEDRRIEQVRELLEQGTRGYDQLGLLLSRAQLELVAPLENRLRLSEKERMLIHHSRAAEAHSRRRLFGGATLALLAMVVAVVGGRALWLSQHRFAQVTEGRLSWFRWGKAVDQPTSPIVIWRGAADPWWIDGLLGYPRDPYETDWVLADLQPAVRDALQAGVDLPAEADLWLESHLSPLAEARERFVAGELDGAADAIQAVSDDPALGPGQAITLAPVLALGEPAPDALMDPLLRVAEAWAVAQRVPGGDVPRLEGEVGSAMGLLLHRVPIARWSPSLERMASSGRGAELAGRLLEAAAPPEAMGAIARELASRWPANVESALAAVQASGACAWQGEARAAVLRAGGTDALTRLMISYLLLTPTCGEAADLPVLNELLQSTLDGRVEIVWANDALRSMYLLDHDAAYAALKRYEPLLYARREVTRTPWAWIGARDMISLLTPGGPQQIHARLYLGDPTAVGPALEYGPGDRTDPSRASWLWPLVLYRGEALVKRERELLEEVDQLPISAELALRVAAARSGDPSALEVAARGLASPDLLPVQVMMNQLAGHVGPLPAGLGGAGRQAALARGVVALRRGEASDVDFAAALRDPSVTGLESMLAVEGQRRRWAVAALDEVLDGLRDPSRRVRLAATLALATRSEPLPDVSDARLTRSLQRARWARHALAVDVQLQAEARASLEAGQPLRARQLALLSRSVDGVPRTVDAVLSPELPNVYPAEIEDETIYLQMLADLRSGFGASTEWMITYVPPAWWGRYATDPLLADRQDLLIVRVLSGQSPPVLVEDL